jgi:hypothetical protein
MMRALEVEALPGEALRGHICELAADVGRLRRRLEPDSSLAQLADRIAGRILILDLLATPTAAELAATTAPGDDEALTEAIRIVDQRKLYLHSLLGAR